jgi:hypothetical protein
MKKHIIYLVWLGFCEKYVRILINFLINCTLFSHFFLLELKLVWWKRK